MVDTYGERHIIMMDSLETSEQSVALVGKYTHSLWGSVDFHGLYPILNAFVYSRRRQRGQAGFTGFE